MGKKPKSISINLRNVFKDKKFKGENFKASNIAINKTEANELGSNIRNKGKKFRIVPIKKEIDVFKTKRLEATYIVYESINNSNSNQEKKQKSKKSSSKKKK